MGETPKKKDREKQKQRAKRDKEDKMRERKENSKKGKSLNEMMAYVDENGNISATPPDPNKRKVEVKLEDIQIGVPKYVAPTEAELTRTGKVTFFDHAKGFGFIKDQVSQESIFVHANNLSTSIQENDKVTFEAEMGPRGYFAVNVKLNN